MNRRQGRKKLTSFLQKTYELVSDASNDSIVSWTSDGTAFTIHSIVDFTTYILPRYFKHSNFASFVRQLNMYSFHKERGQRGEHVFRHQCFLKGRKKALKEIRRKSAETPSATDDSLSKLDCEQLLGQLHDLQREHSELEMTAAALRTENRDMAALNQDLGAELVAYKEREKRLEGLLKRLSSQLRDAVHPSDSGQEDLLTNAREGRGGESQEKGDSSMDSLKSESRGSPPTLDPELCPMQLEDNTDVDAELERMFHPHPR